MNKFHIALPFLHQEYYSSVKQSGYGQKAIHGWGEREQAQDCIDV